MKTSIKEINIVLGDKKDSWIIKKIAEKLNTETIKLGVSSNISTTFNKNADFNLGLIYHNFVDKELTPFDVLMITHVDQYWKFELLEKLISKIGLGICMSKEQMDKLINLGLDKNKLCYINPAHDGVIPVKKWVIGLASRVYNDGRKNETYFNKLADVLNCDYFKFKIIGANWDPQVDYMRSKGFEVEYYPQFDYEIYTKKFFADMDYYLYMGLDEGQMGFVDAQSAGVKTIVTTQGYHLDSDSPITHPFTTYKELEKIFLGLQKEKMDIVDAMKDWTWENYAIKHLQIYEYLKTGRVIENSFKDGLNSLLENINSAPKAVNEKAKWEYLNYLKRKIVYNDSLQSYICNSSKKLVFLEKIFSIKNEKKGGYKRKVLTLLGIRIKMKKRRLQ